MSKSMAAKLLGILFLLCGVSCGQVVGQIPKRDRLEFPKACYFFVPGKEDEAAKRDRAAELAEERSYDVSFADVYRRWCTPSHTSSNERKAAVDTMLKRWKAVWDRDDPFNTEFHETRAFDLLALLGLTYELPSQMVTSPEFTKAWVETCAENCFTIWAVPENPIKEHGLAMQLWLRNDLLDHLKREPASEPVIKMLEEAQYRLVD